MYIYLTAVTAFPVIKGSAFLHDVIGEIIVSPCTLHKIGYTCLTVIDIWQCRVRINPAHVYSFCYTMCYDVFVLGEGFLREFFGS